MVRAMLLRLWMALLIQGERNRWHVTRNTGNPPGKAVHWPRAQVLPFRSPGTTQAGGFRSEANSRMTQVKLKVVPLQGPSSAREGKFAEIKRQLKTRETKLSEVNPSVRPDRKVDGAG
jgi:hypothetical protein